MNYKTMTVKELIAKLESVDGDMEIYIDDKMGGGYDLTEDEIGISEVTSQFGERNNVLIIG